MKTEEIEQWWLLNGCPNFEESFEIENPLLKQYEEEESE